MRKKHVRCRREEVPEKVAKIAFQRTEISFRRIVTYDDSIREALANAWLQGVIDGAQAEAATREAGVDKTLG